MPVLTLGMISVALGVEYKPLREFGADHGIELRAIKQWIDEVNATRNIDAHEVRMSFADASRIRERWLGVRSSDGGFLVPYVLNEPSGVSASGG